MLVRFFLSIFLCLSVTQSFAYNMGLDSDFREGEPGAEASKALIELNPKTTTIRLNVAARIQGRRCCSSVSQFLLYLCCCCYCCCVSAPSCKTQARIRESDITKWLYNKCLRSKFREVPASLSDALIEIKKIRKDLKTVVIGTGRVPFFIEAGEGVLFQKFSAQGINLVFDPPKV